MNERGSIRSSWVYKKLSSIKTALLIFGLMAFFMILGTIFPQEMSVSRYVSSWGQELYDTYNAWGLLNIFKSWPFLTLTYIFFLNITICTYERYLSLIKKRKLKKDSMGTIFVHQGKTMERITTFSYGDMTGKLHNLICQKGYKIEKRHASDKMSQLIVTKGIPYLLMSIIFHLGVFLCIIGFIQTYLVNYEGYISVGPDKAETVDTIGKETRLYKSLKHMGLNMDGYDLENEGLIKIGMTGFETEYTWFNEGYYPKDWKSNIIIYNKFDEEIIRKKIEVNDPIYYAGFAFYQAAYEQECDLHIGDDIVIKAKPNEKFTIEGQEGKFMIGTIRTGKLFYRFKDKPTDITENLKLYHFPPMEPVLEGEIPKKPKRDEIGELVINETKEIKGMSIYFDNFNEKTVVSYRRDAGVPILWFASILLMVAMCLRIYFPYYKLRIQIEPHEEGRSKVIAGGNSLGLTADLNKQLESIMIACV